MTDALDTPAVRFCWCPPMDDPNDPEQHEAACAHAAFVEQMRRRAPAQPAEVVGAVLVAQTRALEVDLMANLARPSLFRESLRAADLPQPSTGCYRASFGWVHVRPACRCPRN